MESTITKPYDYVNMDISKDMSKWHVTEEEIEGAIQLMAKDHACLQQVQEVCIGDAVVLSCTSSKEELNGRRILLYPGRELPGAQKAEQDVVGKKNGDCFVSEINEAEVTLTVKEISRIVEMPVNDQLVEKAGIEDVTTISQFGEWYRKENDPKKKQKASQEIARTFFAAFRDHSEYDFDQEEENFWIRNRGKMIYDMMVESGHDPHVPEDGLELLSDEEAMNKIVEDQRHFYKDFVAARYLSYKVDYKYTKEQFQKETEERMKEYADYMKEHGITREMLLSEEQFWSGAESAYLNCAFETLMEDAEKLLEV